MSTIPINDIMTRKVITVLETTPIMEAMQLLVKNAISGMPVVDHEGRIKGMITEKDVMEILFKKDFHIKELVSDYMTRQVTVFTPTSDAVELARFFIKTGIRRVPIIEDHKVVGIVSRRDIIELILEAKALLSPDHRYH